MVGGIHMSEYAIANYQGPAKLAAEEDLRKDNTGFTNPNLHRRVNPTQPSASSKEVKPREYKFMRQSVYQLQTTEKFYHDDDSDESETP